MFVSGSQTTAANGFVNKPSPPRRDGLLAGTLKAGAMVIGTSGDILLISVAVKTPPTQQKLPIPSLLQSLTSVF